MEHKLRKLKFENLHCKLFCTTFRQAILSPEMQCDFPYEISTSKLWNHVPYDREKVAFEISFRRIVSPQENFSGLIG